MNYKRLGYLLFGFGFLCILGSIVYNNVFSKTLFAASVKEQSNSSKEQVIVIKTQEEAKELLIESGFNEGEINFNRQDENGDYVFDLSSFTNSNVVVDAEEGDYFIVSTFSGGN